MGESVQAYSRIRTSGTVPRKRVSEALDKKQGTIVSRCESAMQFSVVMNLDYASTLRYAYCDCVAKVCERHDC